MSPMITFPGTTRAFVVLLVSSAFVFGQMTLDKDRTRDLDYRVLQGSAFGEGFVEITDPKADFDPLRNASQKEQTARRRFDFGTPQY